MERREAGLFADVVLAGSIRLGVAAPGNGDRVPSPGGLLAFDRRIGLDGLDRGDTMELGDGTDCAGSIRCRSGTGQLRPVRVCGVAVPSLVLRLASAPGGVAGLVIARLVTAGLGVLSMLPLLVSRSCSYRSRSGASWGLA